MRMLVRLRDLPDDAVRHIDVRVERVPDAQAISAPTTAANG